eukprot:5320007-Pleurochrysis_carterae.AAC.1
MPHVPTRRPVSVIARNLSPKLVPCHLRLKHTPSQNRSKRDEHTPPPRQPVQLLFPLKYPPRLSDSLSAELSLDVDFAHQFFSSRAEAGMDVSLGQLRPTANDSVASSPEAQHGHRAFDERARHRL